MRDEDESAVFTKAKSNRMDVCVIVFCFSLESAFFKWSENTLFYTGDFGYLPMGSKRPVWDSIRKT